ncbi:universal stress protein [Actinoplanes sp. URMC 104]|uniref:universal stress protein n=1 Tax=Actinoplanes sp. URMC 104 TaxID=3423409 RepID=UPI003F1CE001
MTIIAAFSSSRLGSAPVNLAARLARTTGEKVIAAVVVERSLPAGVDPIEDEYRGYLASRATASLERVVEQVRGDLDISVVVHDATSIPNGLTELVSRHGADLVVVGSSSSGLLGRVTLGSVTERLIYTSRVPVALAPRGYPASPVPVRRLTVAYGGAADAVGLIATSAELAKQWNARLRIVSFHVSPVGSFGMSIERSAEDLVVRQWARKTMEAAARQLDDVRSTVTLPDVDVVIGTGVDWRGAVDDVAWEDGDMLLLGSGAAAPASQVFLGSVASRILRHVPVPAMIVPRRQT